MECFDQTIFLFEALLQHRSQFIEVIIKQQQLGFIGLTVFVVELESQFGTGADMGIDAFGELQRFAAGLLEGGDHVIVDFEVACADVVDQSVTEVLQLFGFGQASLFGSGRGKASQPHVFDQQGLPCIQPVVDSLVFSCQSLLGLFQFRQHNPSMGQGRAIDGAS